jgi:hypothetical protein
MEKIKLREWVLRIEKKATSGEKDYLPKTIYINGISELPTDLFRNMLTMEERENYYIANAKIIKEYWVG